MKSIIDLEHERLKWSLETFTEATAYSSLLKCEAEIQEIKECLRLRFADVNPIIENSSIAEEYADAVMCLFDSAGRAGISVEQVIEAFENKLEINKARVWKKNPDNSYSHVK